MSQDVAVYEHAKQVVNFEDFAMSAEAVKRQVALIQDVMESVMQVGEHYGTIPGCGPKPTLLKPGAEKLSTTFRLAPSYNIRRNDLQNGHREYELICTLTHIISGQTVGQGVGACSTMESKYRYRKAEQKCPKCGKETIIKGKKEYGGGWLCYGKKGGCGAKFKDGDTAIENQNMGRVEHDNPADYYNTVLKMAKKRAHVDAVLTATAASDLFTQDVEDMAEAATNGNHDKPPTKNQPTPSESKKETATKEQYAALYRMGLKTWKDVPEKVARGYVKDFATWHRAGDALTKAEASEMIDNWEELLDRYEAEKQMEASENVSRDNEQFPV
jgi:predicted RNA-binding Zn-ribbon protein involved in translation (DUF1610 family)